MQKKAHLFYYKISIWIFLWLGGSALEIVLMRLNIRPAQNILGYLSLLGRDILLGIISYKTWFYFYGKKHFKYTVKRIKEKNNLETLFAVTIFIVVIYYYYFLQQNQNILEGFSIIYKLFYPLRMFFYVCYQQAINTLFLLDVMQEKYKRHSILFTAILFGLSHIGGIFICFRGYGLIMIMSLAFIAMLIWGFLRQKYQSVWPAVLIHYLFWLSVGYKLIKFL